MPFWQGKHKVVAVEGLQDSFPVRGSKKPGVWIDQSNQLARCAIFLEFLFSFANALLLKSLMFNYFLKQARTPSACCTAPIQLDFCSPIHKMSIVRRNIHAPPNSDPLDPRDELRTTT